MEEDTNLRVWAAGVFDGEGSTTIQRVHETTFEACCSVSNNDPSIIKPIHDRWGGRLTVYPKEHRKNATADHFRVEFRKDEIIPFLQDIIPYLKGRKVDEARLVILAVRTTMLRECYEKLRSLRKDGFDNNAAEELRATAHRIAPRSRSLQDEEFYAILSACKSLEERALVHVISETRIAMPDFTKLTVQDVINGLVANQFRLSEATKSVLQEFTRGRSHKDGLFLFLNQYPNGQKPWYLWARIRGIGARVNMRVTPLMLRGSRLTVDEL